MARKSQAPQKREQIAWALFDCLAENGHENITIKRIAARAGLPHGVIHYYFEKKDDIVNALVEALAALYQEKFQKFLESSKEGSGDNIEKMFHYLVEAFVFDRRLNRVFYNLVQMGFERRDVSVPLRRLLDAYRGNIGDMLVQAGAGEQSGPLSMMVVAVIEGLALQWMIDPDELDRQEVWNAAGRVREVIKSSFSAGPEDNQAVT